MSDRKERIKKSKYLDGYYWALQNIEMLQEKIKCKNDRLYSVRSPKLSDMPRGGTPVTTLDMIADKSELEIDLKRMLKKLWKRKWK